MGKEVIKNWIEKKKLSWRGEGRKIVIKIKEGKTTSQAYHIHFSPQGDGWEIFIIGKGRLGTLYGVVTLLQIFELAQNKNGIIEAVNIWDEPGIENRGILFDLGGQMAYTGPASWNFAQWKEAIDWMRKYKLNLLLLEICGAADSNNYWNPYLQGPLGYPIKLEKYPHLVIKDMPILRWDRENKRFFADKFTPPLVKRDFLQDIIDYSHKQGIKVYLFLAYYYFATIVDFYHKVFTECYSHPENIKFFNYLLKTLLTRYSGWDGITLHLPETMMCECSLCNKYKTRAQKEARIIRRAYKIVRDELKLSIDFRILDDQFRLKDLEELKKIIPSDIGIDWVPQRRYKEWKEAWGNVWEYLYLTKAIFQKNVHSTVKEAKEILHKISSLGYQGAYTQGWYWDNYQMNFLALSEFSWRPEANLERFWDKVCALLLGENSLPEAKQCLKKTEGRQEWISVVMNRILNEQLKFNMDVGKIEERVRKAKECLTLLKKVKRKGIDNPFLQALLSSTQRRIYFWRAVSEYSQMVEAISQKNLKQFMHHYLKGRKIAFKHYELLKEIDPDFPWFTIDANLLWAYDKAYIEAPGFSKK